MIIIIIMPCIFSESANFFVPAVIKGNGDTV